MASLAPECRSTFVNDSWTMRYAASSNSRSERTSLPIDAHMNRHARLADLVDERVQLEQAGLRRQRIPQQNSSLSTPTTRRKSARAPHGRPAR